MAEGNISGSDSDISPIGIQEKPIEICTGFGPAGRPGAPVAPLIVVHSLLR